MKPITILILTSIFAFTASAQRIAFLTQNNAAKPVQSVQPVSQDSIIFDKLEHDYGTMEFGGDGNTVFTFANKGKAPVVLTNVRASCGCTTPEWTKTPVAPGDKGEIKVKYNTNLPGTFNKSITVSSNAANSNILLRIKGNVKPKE